MTGTYSTAIGVGRNSIAVVTQRLDKPTRREIYLDQCDHGRLGKYGVFLVLLGDVCQVCVTAV